MTNLSIVIVNYKVKYFLRQCIQSIYNSQCNLTYDIIVVDNASDDGSVEMLEEYFPKVKLIANKDNVGFSKANNQGFAVANSKYVLILNPDTILQEDTLQTSYDYAEAHPDVGAIGVRMIDGKGQFLPESKRGFPTPLNAIWKMLKVSKLFPKSSFFNRYYMGHIGEYKTHDVDVLTGAYMWVRKEAITATGGFDEDYFMYGEDIELSYQIRAQDYRIVYLPTTSIIHFKGESTKKSSVKYLRNFYGAMGIYANKRNSNNGFVWKLILQLGIVFSAVAFVLKQLIGRIIRPLVDVLLLFGIGKILQKLWARFYFDDPTYYQDSAVDITLGVLIAILILVYYLFGQYDKRHNIKHLSYGFLIGTLAMFSVYSLLPLELRFSRLVLVMLVVVSPFVLYVNRRLYNLIGYKRSAFNLFDNKRIAIVGSDMSCTAVDRIADNYSNRQQIIGHITDGISDKNIGALDELEDTVDSRNINEIIFCSKDLSSDYIFQSMAKLGNKVSYKIANDDNRSILGSDSKDKAGEWYALDIAYKINQPFHIRLKRIFDIGMSILLLLGLPIFIIISPKRKHIYSHVISVLMGSKTWIGYHIADNKLSDLPAIKNSAFQLHTNATTSAHEANLYYARNYSIWLEVELMYKFLLDRR